MYILCIYVINTELEVLGYQIMGGGEGKGKTPPKLHLLGAV